MNDRATPVVALTHVDALGRAAFGAASALPG
jgi:hypothetical protein